VSTQPAPRIAGTAQTDSGARLESGAVVWELAHVRENAVIGVRAVCIAPVEIGEWALVPAGALVMVESGT
jgi:UDP-3-O-[3-hydroxymyristoyl] glucosamine N-acyltransferase